MKKLLILIIFSSLISFANAQIHIGILLNSSLNRDFSSTFWQKYSVGLIVETPIKGIFSIRGSLSYDYNYVEPVDMIHLLYWTNFIPHKEIKTNILAIETDIILRLLQNDSKSNLYISLGPQFRTLISGKYVTYFDETFKISPRYYQTFTLFAGIGYSYKINDKINIFAEPVFGLPFTNKRSYRWSLGLKAGVCFEFVKD